MPDTMTSPRPVYRETEAIPETQPEPPADERAEPRPGKYLVGVLYYGPIDREHDRCVKALHGHPRVAATLELTGCPYIDIGRGIIATKVLDDPSFDGVLFIDHDMVFERKEAIATIESAIEADATVGAAYSMRKPGHIIGAVDGTKVPDGEKIRFFEGGQRLPANYLGMGMTAIPRSVLVRLVEASKARYARQQTIVAELRALLARVTQAVARDGTPLDPTHALDLLSELEPELRDEDLPRLKTGISDAPVVPFFSLLQRDGYYYGEDVAFCVRSHLAGVGIHLDTRIRVYHKGSYCYGIEDVGMEVPYCDSLEVIDKRDPQIQATQFSESSAVRDALAARKTLIGVAPEAVPDGAPSDVPLDAPTARASERTSFPQSFDPTLPSIERLPSFEAVDGVVGSAQ